MVQRETKFGLVVLFYCCNHCAREQVKGWIITFDAKGHGRRECILRKAEVSISLLGRVCTFSMVLTINSNCLLKKYR